MVRVRWLDSCILHAQVDDEGLPTPSELETVGWLSKETDGYIVVSRDHSPAEDSYSWRSSLAIPRAHVLDLDFLESAGHSAVDAERERFKSGREYSKQREEELERALRDLQWAVSDTPLQEPRSAPDPRDCIRRRRALGDALRAAWAALAENGDTGSETQASGRCGCIMVGYGGEGSHLPTCKLPEGHKGRCSAETGDTDD